MNKLKVFLSLTLTAILCICLASCDLSFLKERKEENTTTSAEETQATLPVAEYNQNETTSIPAAVQITTTTQPTTLEDATTKVAKPSTAPTTAPTTKPAPTTVAPPPPTTTTKPVETTVAQTTAPTTSAPKPTTAVIDTEDSDYESDIIKLVNNEREEAGFSTLVRSDKLSDAAAIRAKEIATSFSHTRPDGSFWYTVSPYAMGENIAKGYSTPKSVMEAWMNSEGHKDNILTKEYRTIGVGCYYDSDTDTYYWVQLFGVTED